LKRRPFATSHGNQPVGRAEEKVMCPRETKFAESSSSAGDAVIIWHIQPGFFSWPQCLRCVYFLLLAWDERALRLIYFADKTCLGKYNARDFHSLVVSQLPSRDLQFQSGGSNKDSPAL